MSRFILGIAACLAATTFASEGDLLVEGGFAAGSRTYTAYENPNLGGTVSVLKSFNDQTDIGLTASFDHATGILSNDGPDLDHGGDPKLVHGVQRRHPSPDRRGPWVSRWDGDGNAMFHVAGRLRGVMEFTTVFRLFAGAAVGTDMGDHGSILAKGEFGAQFLIR